MYYPRIHVELLTKNMEKSRTQTLVFWLRIERDRTPRYTVLPVSFFACFVGHVLRFSVYVLQISGVVINACSTHLVGVESEFLLLRRTVIICYYRDISFTALRHGQNLLLPREG